MENKGVGKLPMKTVAITGATSMLGVALAKACADQGIRVLALVRPGSRFLSRLPDSPLIQPLNCSLEALPAFIPEEACDVFYHFGWTGTDKVQRHDPAIQERNIRYTLEAMDLAKRMGCHTFIGAGSQAEYGRVSAVIAPETPANPDIAYGIAKYAAGKLSALQARDLGLRHIWTRIFSVYGEHDNDQTMIMYSIRKMLQGESPDYTPSEQIWDYLHADDAARAFLLLGSSSKAEGVYCIGSGEGRPLLEFIREICDAAAPALEPGIGKIPYGPTQVMHLCADISTLQRDTGFSPEIPFDIGIRRVIEAVRKTMN